MEYYNNILCVTAEELTGGSEGDRIMSRSCYDKHVARGNLTIVRRGGGLESYALVEWASVPTRFRQKFIEKYGDPEKTMLREEGRLVLDTDAKAFYSEYRLPDDTGIKTDVQVQYSLNASVLNRLIELRNKQVSSRHKCGNSTPVNWNGITAECEALRDEYGHTLPKNASRLREKIREYEKEGYACLVSQRLVNKNAQKITPEGEEYLISLKASHFPQYTNAQIHEEYNQKAEEAGWKPIKSLATVTQFLERPDIRQKWVGSRYGEQSYRQRYLPKMVTLLPDRRDALWYGDGTRLNIYYKTFRDGKYVAASLSVFEVVDAYSETLLGYDIATEENFMSMYRAYRMAIETTGHMPYELAFDGQGGTARADAQEWFTRIARVAHRVQPENPQSKTIENIFGRFQSQVLHRHFGFTGQNITARSEESRQNMDFIMANIDKLPTYTELTAMYAEYREEWNAMPHPKYGRSRQELYTASINEQAGVLTEELRRELFFLVTKKESTFTARGLQVQIDRQQMIYDVYDAEGLTDMTFRQKYTGAKFRVMYDPLDLSVVRLYREDRNYGLQFVTEARPYTVYHRAMQDQQEGERTRLYAQLERNREAHIAQQMETDGLLRKWGMSPDQHGFAVPKLPGISGKDYERIADKVASQHDSKPVQDEPAPSEILPESIGKIEKRRSYLDKI